MSAGHLFTKRLQFPGVLKLPVPLACRDDGCLVVGLSVDEEMLGAGELQSVAVPELCYVLGVDRSELFVDKVRSFWYTFSSQSYFMIRIYKMYTCIIY